MTQPLREEHADPAHLPKSDPRLNRAPAGLNAATAFPRGFMEFYMALHQKYTPRQQALVAKRAVALAESHRGKLPNHLPASEATTGTWKIAMPAWAEDQRNQMTGPSDDAELVVKMLNSGAPGVMLDLEDSVANYWDNNQRGVQNILKALIGELTYNDARRQTTVGIQPSKTVIWNRARGLHISQAGLFPNELTSASLFDVAIIAFQVDPAKLKHPLSFYIPKSESADEAFWWRDVFQEISRVRGWAKDYIKCMALVEAHPMAYETEEYIYNLRDHILGLNLGRWDYMASLIHFNLTNPDWVLPDRNTIPSTVRFFQGLRELLPEVCHKRGILAIGGMTALFPSRTDASLNARALKGLEVDKQNEAKSLMDGAWTGHPDQNAIAVAQFPVPNQISERPANFNRYPDLRPAPKGVGTHTVAGTRAAVRTVIRYRYGVLAGKGASLLDGYMEDLATDRIYRLMIAQRILHASTVPVVDENGQRVKHTREFITKVFDEELDHILKELPAGSDEAVKVNYGKAREQSEALIRLGQFDPV